MLINEAPVDVVLTKLVPVETAGDPVDMSMPVVPSAGITAVVAVWNIEPEVAPWFVDAAMVPVAVPRVNAVDVNPDAMPVPLLESIELEDKMRSEVVPCGVLPAVVPALAVVVPGLLVVLN